ncbi:MAG: hypothetical protein JWR84_790 [Caulobacter sp.]|nr:hypothetical protein [Caulobacter sp.]
MTDAALSPPIQSGALASARPTPAFMAVFSEQLGLIGRAHWREFAILGGFFVLMTAFALWGIIREGMTVDFPQEANVLVALFAMAMGFTLWGREKLFAQGHFATLPVARQQHLLIRVLAGWVWLAAIVAWALIWIAGMGLISGGDLGFDRYLLLSPPTPDGHVALEDLRQIRWTPQTWNWLSAFTTAAVFYLLASAFAIGVRRIVVWSVVATVVFLAIGAEPTGTGRGVIQAVVGDPWGLDNLFTGGMGRADAALTLADGKQIVAWNAVPSLRNWATATAAWLTLSGALVWLAAWRHRER